jgi:hypothetical protein
MAPNNSKAMKNVELMTLSLMTEVEASLLALRNLFPLSSVGLVELCLQRASTKQHKDVPENLNVDWDSFRKIFEGISSDDVRKGVVEGSAADIDCQLLRLMCISDVPTDALSIVLHASSKPLFVPSKTLLGATPLHCACLEASAQVVAVLLAADPGCSVLLMKDSQGRLPLHNACMCGLDGEAPGIVQSLLESDVKKKSLHVKDSSGATPLMIACEFSSATIVDLLLNECIEADKMVDNDFKLENMSEDPLLHRALQGGHRRRNSGVVLKHIIESEVVKDKFLVRTGEVKFHCIMRSDTEQINPLFAH